MATKFKLSITTPEGEFTRTATRPYTHAIVWRSPRAMEAHQEILAGRTTFTSGVNGRWHKDRGFAVTWHGSEQAARNASRKPYMWDAKAATVIGVFAVEA